MELTHLSLYLWRTYRRTADEARTSDQSRLEDPLSGVGYGALLKNNFKAALAHVFVLWIFIFFVTFFAAGLRR